MYSPLSQMLAIFQTHIILSLGPPSSPEVSPSWFKASPVPPGLYSQSFLIYEFPVTLWNTPQVTGPFESQEVRPGFCGS